MLEREEDGRQTSASRCLECGEVILKHLKDKSSGGWQVFGYGHGNGKLEETVGW